MFGGSLLRSTRCCLRLKFDKAFFHHTPRLGAKLFVDRENKFAHDVLEDSLKPYRLFRLDGDAINAQAAQTAKTVPAGVLDPSSIEDSAGKVFETFCALAQYCISNEVNIADERFVDFTKAFCALTHKLKDEEVLEALRLIALLPGIESTRSRNFVELWNTLDVECCRRLEAWDTDQILLVCDAWYVLNLARISDFVAEGLRKFGRKVRRMRPEQLVQAMFFCNVIRRPVYDMFDFENNLTSCVDEMSLSELGIMAMGFFKTQTPIRNPALLEHFYKRVTAELDTVEDITLCAILKVLRYSSKLPQAELMMQLLDGLSGQIDRISLLSCLHAALLGSDLQCCHDEIIEKVLQRFHCDIDQTRLKDLERICLVIGVFNFKSPSRIEHEICERVLNVLQTRIAEILKYPRCFPTCLHFLTLMGYHDPEMISSVLNTNYIRHAYGSNMLLGRELFHLDAYVKINLKDSNYEGHQLPEKYRRTMGKVFPHYIPERNPKYKLNTTDRVLLEIKETTDRVLRNNTFKHILPHFERPDIVICYDSKRREALKLSTDCPEDFTGAILSRKELLGELDTPDVETVAIVVAGWNNIVRKKNRNTGLFDLKLEQLRLLGHKPVVINWYEWYELENQSDRQTFIRRKLANAIKL